MKTIIIGVLVLLSINNCKQEDVSITYSAQTRGFFLEIKIESNQIRVIDKRGGEPNERDLSTIEKQELKAILSKTDFENVEDSESTKSSYDAAAMANLQIIMNETEHQFDFDHGYPPKKLELLVNKIITLSEIVE